MELIGKPEEFNWDMPLWRYMSFEKLASIFESSALYFATPEQFSSNDLHEGAITASAYNRRVKTVPSFLKTEEEVNRHLAETEKAFAVLRKYMKVSCWHANTQENMAMWLNYQGSNPGVVIQTSPRLLKESLGLYRIETTYQPETIRISKINYIDYDTDKYVNEFGFITPYLHKRSQYSYEQEVRIIISLSMALEFVPNVPDSGILVPFIAKSGINRIILSPNADDNFRNKVDELLKKYDMPINSEPSALAIKPRY